MLMMVRAVVLAALLIQSHAAVAQDRSSILAEVRADKYKEARQELEQAIKLSPNDVTLWALNGYVLTHLGRQTEALESYKQALVLSPDYFPALEGAAELEYQKANQSAVPLLEKIVALKPGDQTSHAMLATLAFERHDCARAVDEFERSRTLMASKPDSLNQYGSCLFQLGKPDDALGVFSRVREIQPQNDTARYNLAVVQVVLKKYSEAVATVKPVLTTHAGDGNVLDVLAQAYEGLSDTPAAVTSLRLAIASHPDTPEYYLHFADICLAHASYQVGINMLKAGIQRLPNDGPLYLARGILEVQTADFEQSRKDFEKAEALDPELRYGRGMQGLTDLQANDLGRAEKDIRSRLSKTPQDGFLWYLLGETLAREGAAPGDSHFKEAVRSGEKAVQLLPDFPAARNLLARLYLKEDRTDDAIQQSRLAYQEDTAGKSAQTALYHLITALRKSGKGDEIPTLAKKLADLREQARAREVAERKYTLIEASR